jgi:hypothetical protein
MKDARLCCTAFSNLVDEQCRTHFAQVGCTLYATARNHIAEIKAKIKHVHAIILTGRGDPEEQAHFLERVFLKAVRRVVACSTKAQDHLKWLSFNMSLLRMFNLCKCFATFMFTEFEFLSPLANTSVSDEPDSDDVRAHIYDVMNYVPKFVFENSGTYAATMFPDAPASIVAPSTWMVFKHTSKANYSHVVISFLESELLSPPDQRAVLGACPTSVEESLTKNLTKWKETKTTLVSTDINNIALILLTSACDLLDGISQTRKHCMERIKHPSFYTNLNQCIFELIRDSKTLSKPRLPEANVE